MKRRTLRSRTTALVPLAWLTVAGTLSAQTLNPMPLPGPYPVGCSNVEQDFSRIPAGELADSYWRGQPLNDDPRSVVDLLVDTTHAMVTTITVPGDSDLYTRWVNSSVTYASLVCYPTDPSNNRADYPLPQRSDPVPRMQRGADAPIFPAGSGRWPVLVYSHGYGGSPLDGSYLAGIRGFASHGYVVIAPFHTDLNFSAFGGAPDHTPPGYIPVWSEFVTMQAMRPLSLSTALDRLTSDAGFAPHIDLGRVGAFGISQGGASTMLLGGAELNYALLTYASKPVTRDSRIKASVGYIPYFGAIFGSVEIPTFGKDQQGARQARVPYFAISGADDPLAPLEVVEEVINILPTSRGLVSLAGTGHSLSPGSGEDIFTWALTFYDAYIDKEADARNSLASATSVSGGLDDTKRIFVDVADRTDVRSTLEFYHDGLNHYFITADPGEAAALDDGSNIQGWRRTGFEFYTWPLGGPGNEACRFFGTPGIGPSSHFYSIDNGECEFTKTLPAWTYEGQVFKAIPVGGGCAADQKPVTRLYNNGMGGQANHRYVTDDAQVTRMTAQGWIIEGPVFCVPR